MMFPTRATTRGGDDCTNMRRFHTIEILDETINELREYGETVSLQDSMQRIKSIEGAA